MVYQQLTDQLLQEVDAEEVLEELVRDDRTLRLVEDAVRRARARFATVDPQPELRLDPDAPPGRVVRELGWAGFTPNWLLSYNYRGERSNLVRFYYAPDRFEELPWRQTHVRIFADGTLDAHDEPSCLMHKGPHLREETFGRERGADTVQRLLDGAGIDVDRVTGATDAP